MQIKHYLCLFGLLVFISACHKAPEEAEFDETPEAAAASFFHAVYETKDMDTVMLLSTPKMRRIIESYAAISNVQRHVLNQPYDSVNIEIDTGNMRMRTQFADEMSVTVVMSGYLGDKKIDDIRRVHLINIKNHWRVDEIEQATSY